MALHQHWTDILILIYQPVIFFFSQNDASSPQWIGLNVQEAAKRFIQCAQKSILYNTEILQLVK